jgi:hypothetical protein
MDASIPETRLLPDNPTERPGIVLDMSGIAPTVRVGPFGPVPYFPNGLYLEGPGASDSVIRGFVIITQSDPLGSTVCEIELFNPDTSDSSVPDLALCSRGILLFGVNRVVIAGNYINLDSDGITPAGNGVSAINLIDSSNNVIGGASADDRNVVMSSGPTAFGPIDPMITVKLHGWAAQKFAGAAKTASNNSISGNFVGVNAEGLALNARSSGIVLWSSNAVGFSTVGIPGQWGWGAQCDDQEFDPCEMSDNTIDNNVVTNGASSLENIGGSRNTTFRNNTVFNTMPFPFQFNWLEVVNLEGIQLPGPAPGKAINMVISGNRLGIDRNGNPSGLNRIGSLQVTNGDNVLIEDNIITGSGRYGIAIREISDSDSSRNVTITRNSIFGHGLENGDNVFGDPGLGIELAPAPFPGFGVTPNDFQDADTGPNDLQNFPVLNWAKEWEGNIRVHGHLNSEPNKSYQIEFFANDEVHHTGHGEGKRFLGAVSVMTNNGGEVVVDTKNLLQVAIGGGLVDVGDFVTATATLLCTPDVPDVGDCPFGSAGTSEFSAAVPVTE